MNAGEKYFEQLFALLKEAQETQKNAMERAAETLADAVTGGGNIFAFGCSHAGLLADELCYRTGGMAVINSVHAPGLHLDVNPLPMSSQMERLKDYGTTIARSLPLHSGDAVIVHSVSGRNTVTVDFALTAREMGARIIALTNVRYSQSVPSRHPSGKRLMDVCDVLIDDCGEAGDACVSIPGIPEKVAPTSTAAGAAILNAVVARAIELIAARGAVPPVFLSANAEGGDEHNQKMMAEYRNHIFYM